MAKVFGPFFSYWASGSLGKSITCRYIGEDRPFVFAKYKEKSGPRHLIQIENSQVFSQRAKLGKIAYDEAQKFINE